MYLFAGVESEPCTLMYALCIMYCIFTLCQNLLNVRVLAMLPCDFFQVAMVLDFHQTLNEVDADIDDVAQQTMC